MRQVMDIQQLGRASRLLSARGRRSSSGGGLARGSAISGSLRSGAEQILDHAQDDPAITFATGMASTLEDKRSW